MDDKEKPTKQEGRRTLLKLFGLGTAALFTGQKDTLIPRNKENLSQIESSILIFDFVSNIPSQNFLNGDINLEFVQKFDQTYSTHGERVEEVMQKLFKDSGYKTSVEMYPLQSVVKGGSREVSRDQLGNQTVTINISEKDLSEILKKHPDQKIVNLSFQVGRVGLTLEEKRVKELDWRKGIVRREPDGTEKYYPKAFQSTRDQSGREIFEDQQQKEVLPVSREEYLKQTGQTDIIENLEEPNLVIKSAYKGEDAQTNIEKLFALAESFPDKLFFAAVGNEREDLRRFVDRPDNLILVAEWDRRSGKPTNYVYGADLYIDNDGLDLPSGSSFSTAYLSAAASVLFNRGVDISNIVRRLKLASSKREYDVNLEDEDSLVLNPKLLKF